MVTIAERTQVLVQRVDLASIIEFSHDAVITITNSGVIGSCNGAAALLYGYRAHDLIGADAEILIPPGLRSEETAVQRRVTAGEKAEGYRTQQVCRDGTLVTVLLTLSPILDATGAVLGAAAIAHPVGGPHLVHASADPHNPVADIDSQAAEVDQRDLDEQDRRFTAYIDDEFANERERVHEAQGRFDTIMFDERTAEREKVQQAADRFHRRMDQERATERTRIEHAQDRFLIMLDAERAQARTDRDHIQAQMHQGQRLELLGQLAGGVAHDFNNLLGVILNYTAFVAEELAAGPAPNLEAAIRDVGQVQRAAERAADLTHQLLAFARREVIQPRVLDLNHIVADIETLLRRTIGDEILLSTDLTADLWPVLADTGHIEQILVNLAIHARDAMNDGGTLRIDTANIVIDATTEALLKPGRHVRLRVSDTGIGMPNDIIDRVFEPFFTTKPEGSGTGLGLSTVYGIVAQTEGAITIHSRPGAGTTFTILIPATDKIAGPMDESQPYQRAPSGETVLIVEDQEALRDVTERIFTRSGYHVLTATNGAEAVTLAAQHDGEIHLLLTDVVMPTMLGKEAAEKIRQFKPEIEVLFMSGYAQPVLASQGRLDRDVHLIEKPFTASAIIEKAGRILNGHFEGFRTIQPSEPPP
jgi:PAS domain S-box-containing protein